MEEVEAFFAGKLSGEETERVRELLTYYPDMVKVMTAPFPEHPPDVLTPAELAEDRAKLLARVRREQPPLPEPVPIRPRRSPHPMLYVAAALAVVVAGTLAYRYVNRFAGVPVMLSADGQLAASRGSGQTPHQLRTETDYLLKPAFRPRRDYDSYRVELLELADGEPRTIKSWRRVERADDGSFPIELSTKRFAEGRYQLVLYGIDGETERLATYTIRLTAP